MLIFNSCHHHLHLICEIVELFLFILIFLTGFIFIYSIFYLPIILSIIRIVVPSGIEMGKKKSHPIKLRKILCTVENKKN